MAIFNSAYDTTVMRGRDTAEIESSIQESITLGRALMIENGIYAVTDSTIAKPFTQPILIKDPNRSNTSGIGIAFDARSMMKPNSVGALDIRVRDKTDYNLFLVRSKLTKLWIERDKESFKRIHPKLTSIYSTWISGNIARRFALDYGSLSKVQIITAVFFLSLFINSKEFDRRFLDQCLVSINTSMRVPMDYLRDVVYQLEPMEDIHGLVEAIKLHTDDIRLSKFSAGVLVELLISTWMGGNKSELLAVALEHVPTFLSLVYASINETLYRRVGFSKVVMDTLKGDTKEVGVRIKQVLN